MIRSVLCLLLTAIVLVCIHDAYPEQLVKGFAVITDRTGSSAVGVNGNGHSLNVYQTNVPQLPVDASTDTGLDNIVNAVNINGSSTVIQLVSLNAKDFSTSTKQTTGNSYLASIDTGVSTLNVSSSSTAVSVGSLDTKASTSNANTGAIASSTVSINSNLESILSRLDVSLSTVATNVKQPTLSSGRTPVSIEGSSSVTVSNFPSDATVTTTSPFIVGNSTVSTQVLAANASRVFAFWRNSGDTDCWYSLGVTATTNAPIKLGLDNNWTLDTPIWKGAVNAICTSATGSTHVEEQQ